MFVRLTGYKKYLTKDRCVICYGQILTIVADGEFHLEGLVIPSGRILVKLLTIIMA